MSNGIELTAIFIANGLGLLLALQLLLGKNWGYSGSSRELRLIRILVCLSALACIIDPVVFLADGHPGTANRLIVYFGNLFLYIENICLGAVWVVLVSKHLTGRVSRLNEWLIIVLLAVGLLTLAANLYSPIVFHVDENNAYHRDRLFFLYSTIQFVFILDGLVVYWYARAKGGIFKHFPVLQFVLPVFIGMVVQTAIYGVSVVHPTVMIALTGLVNSLRNEALCMDSLTGLYNRTYLDEISREIDKRRSEFKVTALMLDMNGFKEINDVYGHAEGDAALISVAEVLRSTVGSLGITIRYAGDEFVILLNTTDTAIVKSCAGAIKRRLADISVKNKAPYSLSVSIGYCAISDQYTTLDSILSNADHMMYEDKKQYYSDPQRNRRKDRR